MLSVFSHLGEALEVQLCEEIERDPTLSEWELKAFSVWDPLAGVPLTPDSTSVCAEWD